VKIVRKKKADNRTEELGRLRSEVQSLRRQLRRSQSLATLGTMTAMVAHEFNNILTPVINYAQLAKANPALSAKALSYAASGGQRAYEICNAILGLTRDQPPQPAEVKVLELLNDTLSAMARDPARDAIELVVDVPAELTVNTRAVELQQVLLNLLINAREAVLKRPAPRRIEITAAGESSRTIIRISDNGVGIARKDLPRIFDPFYTTGKGSGRSGQGCGLGLSFCRQAAGALGGRLLVASTAGEGSTFSVVLPSEVLAAAAG